MLTVERHRFAVPDHAEVLVLVADLLRYQPSRRGVPVVGDLDRLARLVRPHKIPELPACLLVYPTLQKGLGLPFQEALRRLFRLAFSRRVSVAAEAELMPVLVGRIGVRRSARWARLVCDEACVAHSAPMASRVAMNA